MNTDDVARMSLDDLLKACEAALESASDGPWRAMKVSDEFPGDLRWFVSATPEDWKPAPLSAYSNLGIWSSDGVTSKANADFIALAKNAMPRLIEVVGSQAERIRDLLGERAGIAKGIRRLIHDECADLEAKEDCRRKMWSGDNGWWQCQEARLLASRLEQDSGGKHEVP